MWYNHGAIVEHCGYPSDCGRRVYPPQHHEALWQRPQPRFLLQLNHTQNCGRTFTPSLNVTYNPEGLVQDRKYCRVLCEVQ